MSTLTCDRDATGLILRNHRDDRACWFIRQAVPLARVQHDDKTIILNHPAVDKRIEGRSTALVDVVSFHRVLLRCIRTRLPVSRQVSLRSSEAEHNRHRHRHIHRSRKSWTRTNNRHAPWLAPLGNLD